MLIKINYCANIDKKNIVSISTPGGVIIILLLLVLIALSACTPIARPRQIEKTTSSMKKNSQVIANKTSSSASVESIGANKENNKNNNNRITNTNSKQNKNIKSSVFEHRKEKIKNITSEEDRFVDTTYYFLSMEDGKTKIIDDFIPAAGSSKETQESLIEAFDKIVENLESNNIHNCSIIKYFIDKFDFSDSLQQEAIYQYAECNIINNNLDEAKWQLEELLKNKLNKFIVPKVLVRVGQVCCVLGEIEQAEKYFKKLKKDYPKSIYNKLADCSRL